MRPPRVGLKALSFCAYSLGSASFQAVFGGGILLRDPYETSFATVPSHEVQSHLNILAVIFKEALESLAI